MAILAQDNGSEQREKPAPGMVDAVCVFVVDIGNHLIKSSFGDKIQHRVIFCWEVEEKIQHGEYAGKPFMVSQQFTLSLFEKSNLAKAKPAIDAESNVIRVVSTETVKLFSAARNKG